jgi:uncharacterized protein (TIGR03437 family)
VNVVFVVTPGGSGAAAQAYRAPAAGGSCVPAQLYLNPSSLGSNFSTSVGYPVTLAVQVKDDCDNAISNATVVASFSTSDPALALVHIGNGIYHASWRPGSPGTSTISFNATVPGLLPGYGTLTGSTTGSSFSAISSGGIVPGASFSKSGGLAPGGIISIFGTAMAADTQGHATSSLPLPTSLDGVAVNIAGIDAPLYYASQGQINAQLPFEAPAGFTQAYLRLNRNGQTLFTDSETITVISANPGIFTTNSSGTGQGAILIAASGLLAAPAGAVPGFTSQPAPRGQYITIFCSGLGAVSNQPASGGAAPANPLSNALIAPAVTIGGIAANVNFAGLAPGFVGLYQINAMVPLSLTPGNAVPVVVTQNGLSSNTATIAVQ